MKRSTDDPPSDIPDNSHAQVVYLCDHGEKKVISSIIGNKCKSVITDKNEKLKKDSEDNMMFRYNRSIN